MKVADLEAVIANLKVEISRKEELLGKIETRGLRGALTNSLFFKKGKLAAFEEILESMKEVNDEQGIDN